MRAKRFFFIMVPALVWGFFLMSLETRAFSGGNGSSGSPYEISTCQELQDMRNDLSAYYVLHQNVDCSAVSASHPREIVGEYIAYGGNESLTYELTYGNIDATSVTVYVGDYSESTPFDSSRYTVDAEKGMLTFDAIPEGYVRVDYTFYEGFEPIGTESDPFTGSLDGNEKSIVHLRTSQTYEYVTSRYVGLFGYSGGTIKDLEFSDTYVQGDNRVGTVVGRLIEGGSVENVSVSDGYVRGGDYTGGVVGGSFGTISDAHFSGTVRGNQNTGGLVGGVTGSEGHTGTVTNSSSEGMVRGGLEEVGGLVGGTDTYTSIADSFSTANVSGGWTIGGLVGTAMGSVENSYATGSVTSSWGYGAGGLVGYVSGGSVSGSYATGTVSAKSADFPDVGNIETSYAGGLVGLSSGGAIRTSYATGNVSGTGARVGGLVGGTNALVENCYATGAVLSGTDGTPSDKSNRVGGLVGGLAGPGGIVRNAYATGTVTGYDRVGGLVGYSAGGSIAYSFSTGRVTGHDAYAGLVGSFEYAYGISLTGSVWYDGYDVPEEFDCYGYDAGDGYVRGRNHCTAVDSNIAYFYEASNSPMSGQWNFDGIWFENATAYPTLTASDSSDNTPINIGPTSEKFQRDILDGFIVVNGNNPLDTEEVTFATEYTIVVGETRIVFLSGTRMARTGGGSMNFAEMDAQDIVEALRNTSTNTIAGAVQIGISGINLSFSQPITISIPVGSVYEGQTLGVSFQNEGQGDWTGGLNCRVFEGICAFQTDHATKYFVEGGSGTNSEVTEYEKAHVDSWSAYQYADPTGDCANEVKMTIRGKHFNKKTEVKIGEEGAFSVKKESSKKIVAKFCLNDLQKKYLPGTDKTIRVKNPHTDWVKVQKKIDLYAIVTDLGENDFNVGTAEGVQNIQRALVRLGYLDGQYVTGIFGSITADAISRFQKENGIDPTGTVGPVTEKRLREKLE